MTKLIRIFKPRDDVPQWLFEVEIKKGGYINKFEFLAFCLVLKYSGTFFIFNLSFSSPALFFDGKNVHIAGMGQKGVYASCPFWEYGEYYFKRILKRILKRIAGLKKKISQLFQHPHVNND